MNSGHPSSGSRGALQRPARQRAHRHRQRGRRRGRIPAGAAAARLRGAEELDRAVANGAAPLRGEGAARLRAALGQDHDGRDQPPRRGEVAARGSALLRRHLRQQDDAGRSGSRRSSTPSVTCSPISCVGETLIRRRRRDGGRAQALAHRKTGVASVRKIRLSRGFKARFAHTRAQANDGCARC